MISTTIRGLVILFSTFLTSLSWSQDASKKLYVFVSPSAIGVNAFLQLGKLGTEAAAKSQNAAVRTYESTTAANRSENVRAAINDGATVVVMVGLEFNDIVDELAPKHPKTNFLIVDKCLKNPPPNVYCALFRDHEAAYLLGAEGGLFAQNKIGIVAALDIPFLHRYTDSFAAGAKKMNPGVQVDVRFVGGSNPFNDPVRAKELALALRSAGAEIIFSATAGGDFGVFDVARAQNFKVLSVDTNRCPVTPGLGIDNTIKHVDRVIAQTINAIESRSKTQVQSYGIKEGGMGVLALDAESLPKSGCLVAQREDVIKKVRALAAEIASGKLVIDDPLTAKR